MLAVVKIYEETFEVGPAVKASSWEDAYKKAYGFVREELEARGVDVSCPEIVMQIQEIIKENNYFLFSADDGDWNQDCEPGKAVAIQIIEIE